MTPNKNNCLPNLIVIGAMKSGTTSIHDYLNQHPDIYMSEEKELNFFIRELNWEKGLAWYQSQFDCNYTIRGESSQGYTKKHLHKGVPQRIKEHIPHCKFIYIMRDPIKRFISHVNEAKFQGNRPNNFDPLKHVTDFKNLNYVLTSKYHYQITEFTELFDINQFYFLSLEELLQAPMQKMNEIFSFLGVKQLPEGAIQFKPQNISKDKTAEKPFLKKRGHFFLTKALKNITTPEIRYQIKTGKIFNSLFREKIKEIKPTPELLSILKSELQEDVNQLRALTGKNFDHWTL